MVSLLRKCTCYLLVATETWLQSSKRPELFHTVRPSSKAFWCHKAHRGTEALGQVDSELLNTSKQCSLTELSGQTKW